ncbi:MAG TPA: hypothetical protein VF041_13910 [Gemmatimonadaceae bacterium]
MRIIVGGVLSLSPFGPGTAWHHLHYADGLRRLGHDVYYVEQVEPHWCTDAVGRSCPFERSANRTLFRRVMERFGFTGKATQIYGTGEAARGLPLDSLLAAARDADLLVNISGHVKLESILSSVKRRVYVDEDPVYTQLWRAEYGVDLGLGHHDVFFSQGLDIGTAATPIPDLGVRWHPLLPLFVSEHWPARIDRSCRRFTTIASWGGFTDVHYRGEWYASKYAEFLRFVELPGRVDQELSIALRRHSEDDPRIRLLRANGWILTEGTRIRDLAAYQAYIGASRAEIGVAKNAYVKARSGWLGDRAGHYLASGKPVLAQSTGFERHLPTGRGLLSFATVDEAIAGIESINRDYAAHCRAARELAEEYLDYRRVLPRMLELCTA